MTCGEYLINAVSSYNMNSNIKKSLEYYFDPNKRISLSEFSPESIGTFYDDIGAEYKLFDLISIEWGRIDWDAVSNLDLAGWVIIDILNEVTYKHIFPSLVFELTKSSNLVTSIFLDGHLNMGHVYKDWELEFYLSFDEKLRKLIGSILRNINEREARIALESYWM